MTTLETRTGMAGWGDNRFRGYSVAEDLVGRRSLSQILALAIGVELDANESGLFDDLAVAATLADPHIWPVKLTRVLGAFGGSPMSGFCSGMLATDGNGLGPGSVRMVASWLHQMVSDPTCSVPVAVRTILDSGQRLPGFGVPARKVDERVAMMRRCVEARGRAELPYWATWSEVVQETRKRSLEPNVGSAFAAAVLDLGFSVGDAATAVHICVMPCFLANAVEGAAQRAEFLREVPQPFLDYQGPALRPSPRASQR
jgi:hypothetical protein